MESEDRKLAWAAIVAITVIALEFAWYLLIGPANSGPYQTAKQAATDLLLGLSPEAWTAAFTGVLTVSTVALWKETRRLAKDGETTSKHELRAYLHLAKQRYLPSDKAITFRILNTGATPAKKIRMSHGVMYCGYEDIAPLGDENWGEQTFFCGSGRDIRFRIPVEFSEAELEESASFVGCGLFLIVRIEFYDIFGRPHWTTSRGRIGPINEKGYAPVCPCIDGNDGS